jgi:hypothetical protein
MLEKHVSKFKRTLEQKRGKWPVNLINDLRDLVKELTDIISTEPSIEEGRLELASVCPGKARKIHDNFDNYFKT